MPSTRTWRPRGSRPTSPAGRRSGHGRPRRRTGPRFTALGASTDGTHLGVSQTWSDDGSTSTLMSSADGMEWHDVRTLPKDFYVTGVAPPASPGQPWVVAIEREFPEEARILTSENLVDWTRTTFAKPGIRGLTATTDGWVAIGLYPSRDTGCNDSCRPERRSLYTSDDGQTWVNRPASMPPAGTEILGAAGDGGVLAATAYPSKGGVTVWRLASETP